MATAAKPKADADAAAPAGAPVAAGKGKKKLILILAIVLLLAGAGGGGMVFWMKKKAAAAAAAAEAEDEGEEHVSAAKTDEHKHSGPPTFVPLDPFVVNLADKGSDRYAQIAVTLQIDDAKFADQLKLYMPAIRNNILMVIAHKTADELLARTGKEALANEIMEEAIRPMNLQPEEGQGKGKGKSKSKPHNPITNVHFANFIIQ